jgi:hypothetical protein
MDVSKVLAALRQERAQLDEVIVNLERLEQSRERRRGRPPAALATPRKRGRPRGSKNKTFQHANHAAFAGTEPAPRVMAAGQSAMGDETGASPELI